MSPQGDALIGRTLDGRYRVLSRIADGGMATVYLAVDERLEREVALKVMRPHLVHDETFVSRFRREARSAAALSHPNVVAVYDQGQDDGSVFLAMEYVPGLTLRDVLREEGTLSPRAALDVLEAVLLALAEAHGKGLIHRDVKPENVIINDNGTVKVADFGLARAVSSQTMTSSSGVLLGTVAYLSPEQVERGVADARSDVYAAGLMLFEMLTGTKAFTGETPIHVAYQHVHGGVPMPSDRVPGLPPALDELVAVATSRDPDERPTDAADFLTLVRRTRATLTPAVLDARPDGAAALAAASVPTSTAALPVRDRSAVAPVAAPGGSGGRGGSGASARTTAIALPREPLEGVVVAGGGRRGRNWWPAAFASMLLAAATAWFFFLGPGATATVPSVLDRPQDQAVTAVQAAHLDPTVSEAFSEDVPKGTVMGADPQVGATVRRGSEVVLTVSKGPERYAVPTLAGSSLAEAKRQLAATNLALGKVTEAFSEKVPEGQVVSSSPKAGASVKRDAAVALVVSKGRQPIKVPDFTGKSAQDAEKQLSDLGLTVDAAKQENSDTVKKGDVISQSPRDGTLFKGDTVTLVVSKGPVLVDVPNVVGKQVDEARRILEGAGFRVDVRSGLGGSTGPVLAQRPSSGKQPKGSTIVLLVI
ncbi:Stk1 family PASTA domain-containing Ser/Thr kinase [Phycicoccus sonneratiae]|uniref:Stk1 family PASTA domain-containing Ser/Thr kinase n=1 Tax=Phycicoccus sonneratiae TaxID=2807628 RepID=UPI0027DDB2FA|nr:Stk1 family PASTA domain-containing Ser/Thr kinase [Phycicoccus sonneraticus]